jgi:4-hydroxy-tetrahydrodipicolinate synthase
MEGGDMNGFEGVYVVIVTPFRPNGEVDYAGIRKNVEWLVAQGVHGIVALGSTGEFASLEDQEKTEVAEAALEAVGGRVPVLVGATAETTDKAIAYARQAKQMGAAGVLVLPSYYYTPNQDEIHVHYRRLSESVEIPIMVYNNPWSSKVDIKPVTVARLAELPNVACIKESTGDIKRITEIRTLTEDRITVFCGWEDLAYESFLMGAKGWVCVIGNIMPKQAVALFDSVAVHGDLQRGWELYKEMLPVLRYLEYEGKTQQTLKYVLDKKQLAGGSCRGPRLPLREEDEHRIDALVGISGKERI